MSKTLQRLTTEDSKIVIGLHRIVSEMDRRTKKICKEHNLTFGQFAVLEALHSKGKLTVGEVKDLVLSTDGTIPVITGNLEKMGLITRVQDKSDKRKFILALTDNGETLITEVIPDNNIMLSKTLEALTDEEKDLLIGMVRKIRDHNSCMDQDSERIL